MARRYGAGHCRRRAGPCKAPVNVSVSWMEYSVATAGISWRTVAWDVSLVVVIGLPLLYALWRNRAVWRREGQPFKLLVTSVLGVVFVVGGLFGVVRGVYTSVECLSALSTKRFERASGPVALVARFEKAGAGYAVYQVGGREFRTYEGGLNCDCGYLVPFGRVHRLSAGQDAEVRLLGDRAIVVRSPRVES